MSTTELAKFCHSLPETELTRHCQKVQPNQEFGRSLTRKNDQKIISLFELPQSYVFSFFKSYNIFLIQFYNGILYI